MSSPSKALVIQYYHEMLQSIKANKINYSKLLFADHAVFIGPGEKHEGKEAIEQAYTQFISVVESFEIKRQIVNHDSACTLIEYKTKISSIKVEMSEWIEIKERKIVEFRVYFDPFAWSEATEKHF